MYFFSSVRQAQKDLHAKYKEIEKELAKYKEREAAFLATPPPPNRVVPSPKVVSAAPKVVVPSAPPKVVPSAPTRPEPLGSLEKPHSSTSSEGRRARWEKRRRSWKIILSSRENKRKRKGGRPFLTSFGSSPTRSMAQPSRKRCLKSAGAFGDGIIGQIGIS